MRKDFERCYLSGRGNVAVITLNHPETMNAASFGMIRGASDALDAVEAAGEEFRAVILTGEGRGFCSGANLTEKPGQQPAQSSAHPLETIYHPFLRRIRNYSRPIVTAVNGPAAGVGMSIALMGDLTIAARSAYFLQAFARIGLVPDGGSSWILPRLIGLARARELSMMAERLPAETAREWGLINRVVDDAQLMDEAFAMAKKLADGPTSLRQIRRLYWESAHNGFEVQLDLERQMQQQASLSRDFAEGVAAFREKRTAKFSGT